MGLWEATPPVERQIEDGGGKGERGKGSLCRGRLIWATPQRLDGWEWTAKTGAVFFITKDDGHPSRDGIYRGTAPARRQPNVPPPGSTDGNHELNVPPPQVQQTPSAVMVYGRGRHAARAGK